MASTSDLMQEIIAIDEEYASVKQGLSKSQDKELQNFVAEQRVKDYGLLGRGMNVVDRMTSIPVRGNTDIVIENPSDKLLYTQLAKEIINQEAQAREGKADGGSPLKGKQKKLDANKDGKISGEDFALLRERKSLGGLASKLARRLLQTFGNDEKVKKLTEAIAEQKEYMKGGYEKELKEINKAYADGELTTSEYQNLNAEVSPEFQERVLEDLEYQLEERLKSLNADIEVGKAEGGQDVGMDISRSQELAAEQLARKQLREEGIGDTFPDDVRARMKKLLREGKAKGGTMDDQMNALAISVSPAKIETKEMNSEMLPDEEMEEEYVDYVVESTLDDEDKNYLNRALEKDAKLSEIFDQVVESATEFTGSGTVEGPGTGISDSIPARLSDGEFVFTAKATEEIGEDRLMSMMKEAEARADGRQDMANGGMVMQEEPIFRPQPQPTQQDIRVTKETVGAQASMREEEDLIGNELKKSMLSTAPYVRS